MTRATRRAVVPGLDGALILGARDIHAAASLPCPLPRRPKPRVQAAPSSPLIAR